MEVRICLPVKPGFPFRWYGFPGHGRQGPFMAVNEVCTGARNMLTLQRDFAFPETVRHVTAEANPHSLFLGTRLKRGVFLSDKTQFVRQETRPFGGGTDRVAPESLTFDTMKPENKTVKYSFRLTPEENERFLKMAEQAGCTGNRSKFIVARLLGVPFKVYRIDPAAASIAARLDNYYYQFSRLGNNYNQVVKKVNTHFSERTIPSQLYELEQYTRDLKRLSEQIIRLAADFKKEKE